VNADSNPTAVRPGDSKKESEVGQDAEEAAEAKVPRVSVRPTQEEVEKHNVTHLPFRSWCPCCVAGKAKSEPHRTKDPDRPMGTNIVSIDYAFLNKQDEVVLSDEEDEVPKEGETKKTLPTLVLRDRRTKYVAAMVVPRKGDHPYTVDRVGKYLREVFGYKRVIIKSDQERAIKKLKAAVRAHHEIEVQEEESAVGRSSSNGEVENAVQQVEGQVRTLKAQLESRIGEELPNDHDLLPWLVTHAAALLSRFKVGEDGMTAYRRLRGREFQLPIAEFGESVWFAKNKSALRGKLDARWATGVYLGTSERTNESYVAAADGVLKIRGFRRKGSEEER